MRVIVRLQLMVMTSTAAESVGKRALVLASLPVGGLAAVENAGKDDGGRRLLPSLRYYTNFSQETMEGDSIR